MLTSRIGIKYIRKNRNQINTAENTNPNAHLKNRNLLATKLVVFASMVCSLHTSLQSHPTDDDYDYDYNADDDNDGYLSLQR